MAKGIFLFLSKPNSTKYSPFLCIVLSPDSLPEVSFSPHWDHLAMSEAVSSYHVEGGGRVLLAPAGVLGCLKGSLHSMLAT